ncbi:hypothetical protein [Streptomyces sp. bgisy100]|uniref:hypothetical protein n=1 Tax=Streptomyces sp. bgisy100 TaxID=3413783 RepID=UPI003D7028EF
MGRRTGRRRQGDGARRAAAAAGSLMVLALVAGCGSADGSGAADTPRPKPRAVAPAPAKVERIAALTGCKVNIRTEADELREGVCRTSAGDYLITTFPKEKYKLTWLDSASMYGGKYLVGPRWAVSGKPGVLERLRAKVGGRIQELRGPGGGG